MKKTILATLAPFALGGLLISCTGCAGFRTVNDNTPHTTITGKICGQPFSIENPKDTVLEGLEVMASTNGTASIKITRLSTVMNPAVIDSTGTAGEKLVTATGTQVRAGIEDGIKIGTKIAAGAAGNPAALFPTPIVTPTATTNQP